MISAQNTLQIFDNFRVDRTLPKHRRATKGQADLESDGGWEGSFMSAPAENFVARRVVRINGVDSVANVSFDLDRLDGGIRIETFSWWRQAWGWIVGRLVSRAPAAPTPAPAPAPELTIPEFFAAVARTTEQLELSASRARGYEVALESAEKAGQKALVEQLQQSVGVYRAETQLIGLGMSRYLTEEALIRFVKACPKGLRLDWISSFTRVVPNEVLDKKVLADHEKIFDNYVVLHYDPERKAWAETEAEKRARKDPVLFGVLQGSRKLYYVGDWVDAYCDLTLDKIAEALGAPAETLESSRFA